MSFTNPHYLKLIDSLANDQVKKKKKGWWQKTIDPYQTAYILWKQVVSISVILILIEIPFELFFGPDYDSIFESKQFLIYRSFIIVILFMDMCISFNVQYIDEGALIKKRKEILTHYVTDLFFFDIIPLVIIILSTFFPIPLWIELIFLLKIKSLAYSDLLIQETLMYKSLWLTTYKLFRLILIIFYCFHFYGCIFYSVGFYSYENNQPTWINFSNSPLGLIVNFPLLQRYIITTFYAVETLVSAGYGEITALNSYQIGVADLVQISSCFLVLYALTSISTISDHSYDQYETQLLAAQKFMNFYKISNRTKKDVIEYLEFYFDQLMKRDFETEQIVQSRLPLNLRQNLLYQAYKQQLNTIQWIKEILSPATLQQVCSTVSEELLQSEYDIFRNESQFNIYIILKGSVDLLINGCVIGELSAGNYFGDYSFITQLNRKAQAQTSSFCQLLVIRYDAFLKILQSQPDQLYKFFRLKDQLIFQSNMACIGLSCLLCSMQTHLCVDCPLLNPKIKYQKKTLSKYMEQQKFESMFGKSYLYDTSDIRQSTFIEQDRRKYERPYRRERFVRISKDKINELDLDLKLFRSFNIDRVVYQGDLEGQIIEQQYFIKTSINIANIIKDNASPYANTLNFMGNISFFDFYFPIIDPSNTFFKIWKMYINLLTILLFIIIPLLFFYLDSYYLLVQDMKWQIIRIYITLNFLIDMSIEVRVDYRKRSQKEKGNSNRKTVALIYLSTNFIFEFVPLCTVTYFCFSQEYIALHLLILLRIVPLYKSEQVIMQKLRLQPSYEMVYLIFRMFIEILYLNHFFGCLFYGAGIYVYNEYPDQRTWINDSSCNFGVVLYYNNLKKYVLSTYWAINALTTVGYGDIVPLNVLEIVICNFAMVSAILIVTFNISNILQMKSLLSVSQFKEENFWIQQFMIQKSCSRDMRREVENYLRSYYQFYGERDLALEDETFSKLPQLMRQSLTYEAYSGYFAQHWISQHFNKAVIIQLCQLMKETLFSPGEVIFKDKQFDKECCLYYLIEGHVLLYFNLVQIKELAHLKRGAIFGDYSFLTGMARSASAMAMKYSQSLVVKRNDFMEVLKGYPKANIRFDRLRTDIINYQQYDRINLRCFTCDCSDHLSLNCPMTQYKPPAIMNTYNFRDSYWQSTNFQQRLQYRGRNSEKRQRFFMNFQSYQARRTTFIRQNAQNAVVFNYDIDQLTK